MSRSGILTRLATSIPLVALTLLAAFAPRAQAQPVLGFIEDFPGTSLGSWSGGAIYSNPGTGGFGGAGDGYLVSTTLSLGNLGTVSFGAEYAGDWVAAGITQVRCWMRDEGGSGDLSIHLSFSDGSNTWQQDAGIVPPTNAWGLYVVDLVEGDFTHNRGSTGTFTGTLSAVDRFHFRHDLPPYGASPDIVQGSFGLDHVLLTNGTVSVEPGSFATRPVLLAPPYPNPARGRVTFQIHQPEALPVTLTLLDAAGRQVRKVEFAGAASAPRLWMWDGTGDDGFPLPAGVYRAIARGANGGMARTVTLLR